MSKFSICAHKKAAIISEGKKEIWNNYNQKLKDWAVENNIKLPTIPDYATNNAHMFFLTCESLEQRTAIIKKLKEANVLAVFHYLSLHSSPYYTNKHDGRNLPNSDKFSDCLIRLPLFYELDGEGVVDVILK